MKTIPALATTDLLATQPCWKDTGVWGSNTCQTLSEVSHCYDCRVYAAAGAELLYRSAPNDYKDQQTAQLATVPEEGDRSEQLSVLIFRLGREWLALPAGLFQQILPPLAPHTLPHRSNQTLLGIVNIRGQLLLKVSLFDVLGLGQANGTVQSETATTKAEKKVYPRMVVMEKTLENGDVDKWVFDVDELHGIHSLPFGQMEAAAAGVSGGASACTRHVFSWGQQRVNFLDDVRLFEALRHKAL